MHAPDDDTQIIPVVTESPHSSRGGTVVLVGVLLATILISLGGIAWFTGLIDGGDPPPPAGISAPATTTPTIAPAPRTTTSAAPTASSTRPTSSAGPRPTSSTAPTTSQPTSAKPTSTTPSAKPTSTPATTSSTKPTPSTQPRAAAPAGATRCGTGGGATAYATTEATSCPFAINTAKRAAAMKTTGGTITVHSPVTGQDYSLDCVPQGTGRLDCTGGTGAHVTLMY
ncbi:hypothetical protein C1Y63_01275 [Corynebacterium sp. 13CS0277]|uniref:hypothetical protein n=1 Tax=Corynebacterium sp. 13CS0277 TaxID=2071994 RepID=UPI000D038CD9|nr:hypothetical protein [Corynebacterium sp. 13CS0277]PRQ12452.1 hypothetical protein C1Y63_01275 [Corynebacterium sp. 13CS0277]